jgi:hypothetical protein
VFFRKAARRVRYKIKMQGFGGLARCGNSCGHQQQIEAAASVPLTRSTFAYYQPQSLVNLLLSKLRSGLEKSEWSPGIAGFKIFAIPPLPRSPKARGSSLFSGNLVVRF